MTVTALHPERAATARRGELASRVLSGMRELACATNEASPSCVICRASFIALKKTQLVCGRSCGAILRDLRRGQHPEERFLEKVKITAHGLEWDAALDSAGYGNFGLDGGNVGAHCFAYKLWVGPIPPGCEVDHLCRIHHCVTPDHLDPVTHKVNVDRGLAPVRLRERNPGAEKERAITHCPQNHEYTPENTWLDPKRNQRHCKACNRDRMAALRAEARAARKAS